MDKSGGVQHTIANFNMYVGLPHNFKGTHMSRFVEILNSTSARSPSRASSRCCAKWSSAWRRTGHIEMTFPYFIKKAPVSGRQSLMDYEVTFIGEICEGGKLPLHHEGRGAGHQPVPLLEEDLGARRPQPALPRDRHRDHQRFRLDRGHGAWPKARPPASCTACSSAPGREVRHRARLRQSEVRRGHGARRRRALNADPRIDAYVVESENFESIHNHSAYALIERNKKRY
jgi:GTP cyclohydrolase I